MVGKKLYVVQRKEETTSTLKQIVDLYAEETVSDEHIERILEPVVAMIQAGKFDRPRRSSHVHDIKPLIAAGIVATVTLAVALV